ncbi:MAG: hypothetical protein ACYTAN_08385 [Planctomycetota bacterium]|jgi:hypothetical protein
MPKAPDEEALPRLGFFERHFPTIGGFIKLILAILILLIVGFLVTVVVLNIIGSRRLRDARARAAEALVPLTSEAFYAKYPKPPHGENAANYYKAAFLVLEAIGKDRVKDLTRPKNGAPEYATDPLSQEYVAALRGMVEDYRLVMELLAKGAKLPRCSYDVDPGEVNPDMPHLVSARRCAELLSLAVLLASLEGRGEDGIALARDGLALSRSLAGEPIVMSSLRGMNISSITLSHNLQRLISSCEISDGGLAALQEDLEHFAAEFSVRPGLEGELVHFSAIFEALMRGYPRPFGDLSGHSFGLVDSLLAKTPGWVKGGYLKCDQAAATNFYLDLLAAIELVPVSEVEKKMSGTMTELEKSPFIFSRMLLPVIWRANLQAEKTRARLAATAAAIAALRFKKAEGRWPDRLDELVGRYVEAVPLDTITGAPFIYKVLDDGIVVYSVGQNGQDDGGEPDLVKPAGGGPRGWGDDCGGFRIWDGVPVEKDEED